MGITERLRYLKITKRTMTQRNDGNESIFPQGATPFKKIPSSTSCWNDSTSENPMTVLYGIKNQYRHPQVFGMTRQMTGPYGNDGILVPLYSKKKKERGGG